MHSALHCAPPPRGTSRIAASIAKWPWSAKSTTSRIFILYSSFIPIAFANARRFKSILQFYSNFPNQIMPSTCAVVVFAFVLCQQFNYKTNLIIFFIVRFFSLSLPSLFYVLWVDRNSFHLNRFQVIKSWIVVVGFDIQSAPRGRLCEIMCQHLLGTYGISSKQTFNRVAMILTSTICYADERVHHLQLYHFPISFEFEKFLFYQHIAIGMFIKRTLTLAFLSEIKFSCARYFLRVNR